MFRDAIILKRALYERSGCGHGRRLPLRSVSARLASRSESLRTVTDAVQALVTPQRLHGIRAPVISNHVEGRAGDLQALADPSALVADFPALPIELGPILDLASRFLGARISESLGDFMPEDNRDTVQVSSGRGIDEVLTAAAARIQHVGHIGEGDSGLHAGI